ncbi:hypothetical protein CMV30_06555 [Nibricoccus aquaticus]|uniref:Uncharacterized protein n=1 Tax=Nibricoccus aquaticus TaxID=2576891 RepID=A0A290Q5T4_9BACT|nr:tetratricopeptide repeat protein [Nibricoccus aquaticus]ATC63637.1 hypothetical protein CMV30_06555 [Nibricoccus aquaticus]
MPPAQPPTPATTLRLPWPLIAALVLGLALLATYSNSFRVPFLFDDDSSISENLTLRSWRTAVLPPSDSGVTVSGRPLLNATFALNWALTRNSVPGYHALNLLIHFLAALTLFALTRRTLRLSSVSQPSALNSQHSASALALAVSALWALHPLQTESVTYIVQRAESLVGLFYLLTLYSFVRSIDTPSSSRRWQILTVLACLAGMASKEVMVSAPLIVFLFDRTFVSGSFSAAWRAHKKLHLALAATWLLLAACILSTGNRGGTVGAHDTITSWNYFLTQCHALTHYLRLTAWPHPLVLDYGTTTVSRFSTVAPQFFALVALGLATLFALWKRPALGFLGTVFFAVLAPTSSVVPVITQTMAEHRMYLALAPLMLAFVLLLHRAHARLGLALALALAVIAASLSFNRNNDYRDAFTLWEKNRIDAPLNQRSLVNLGNLHAKKHDYPRALAAFQQAAAIAPDDLGARTGIASSLAELNQPAEAIAILRRALEIKPDFHEAHYNLGKILLEQNDVEGALTHLSRALELKPSSTDSRYNLGNALLAARRPADAATRFREVLALDPDAIDARNNLGNALVATGHIPEAIAEYHLVLEKSPAHPRTLINLGRAFAMTGRTDEALRHFEQAASSGPDLPEAHANLAIALLAASRPADAVPHFETALRLGLHDPALRLNLGNALALSGRTDEALLRYRALVSDFPNYADALSRLALTLLQTGRPADAIPLYQDLLKLTPDSPEAFNNLGIASAQIGRMADARACFEQAIKLAPQFTEARENLARTLAQ